MKLGRKTLQNMILQEFENTNRVVAMRDQAVPVGGTVMAGHSQSMADVIIDSAHKMNQDIFDDETLSFYELEYIRDTLMDNMSLAFDTLAATVNRKYQMLNPESGE
tara:strand:- start:26 stop:343 length:318 start_codon:yes stop_codon:yes gene_type:complete